jgi:hypothetical protein
VVPRCPICDEQLSPNAIGRAWVACAECAPTSADDAMVCRALSRVAVARALRVAHAMGWEAYYAALDELGKTK